MQGFTLREANQVLALVKVIVTEIVERRTEKQRAVRVRESLSAARTPEGLQQALSDLDCEIATHEQELRRNRRELEQLGLTVLRMNPVTLHFPGRTATPSVVFCWMEGDTRIDHGHPVGKEDEARRPLKVRELDGSPEKPTEKSTERSSEK